jgi:hypothetical protein
MSATGPARH